MKCDNYACCEISTRQQEEVVRLKNRIKELEDMIDDEYTGYLCGIAGMERRFDASESFIYGYKKAKELVEARRMLLFAVKDAPIDDQ